MAPMKIRNRRPRVTPREADMWLLRAARARRIAMNLSKTDAEIALAHAVECEAEAMRASERNRQPIAA